MHLALLLIEDNLDTRRLLLKRLRRAFPNASIDIAESVNEAHERIASKASEKLVYDGIVQDLKLPKQAGNNPEVDLSTWFELNKRMSACFIVYITAYPDDPCVNEHLAKHCLDSKGELIPALVKKEAGRDWCDDIVAAINRGVRKAQR